MRLALVVVVVLGVVFAVVWITASRAVVPGLSAKLYPIHYKEAIAQVAERYHVDPYMVAAIVKTESGYDPEALSRAGAVGLMQLMPDTADWVTGLDSWKGNGTPVLTDPEDNLELGTCYLAFLLQRFGGDTRPALAAYNAGQGTVVAWVQAAGGSESFDLSDIRFPETRNFVQRVEHYRALYARLYPRAFAGVARLV
jgi:soluble lytic murein transglycosylase